MESSVESLVVGVRFSKVGKVYHFEAKEMVDLKIGDMVVVETSRGWQLGQVAQVLDDEEKPPEGWKPIDRRATPRDLLLRQLWQQKESEVVASCKAKAADLNLVGIKIVSAEYSFDGSRLTILFSSETEEKYDLKSLRGDMQKLFAPSQVEMRQIGPRDVAKLLCGMGACGLETRCCCSFLTEFSSISIRMAKEQGISLTPSEITGMCGRLRCCLIYEYDQYVDARKSLPKRNKRVRTPQGEGKVVDVVPLRESVLVELPDVGVREFPGTEVTVIEGDGSARPAGDVKPAEGDIPVVTQPSEIDQVLSGEEVSPDRVEGVGDSGSLGPVEPTKQRPPRRDWKQKPEGGARQSEGAGRWSGKQDRTDAGPSGPERQQPRERDRRPPADRGPADRPQGDRSPDKNQPERRPGENQRPQGQGRRNPQNRGKGPRPPQGGGPAQDRGSVDRGAGAPGNAGEQDKGNTPGNPTERNNKDFRNKRRGRRQHGRDDSENRA